MKKNGSSCSNGTSSALLLGSLLMIIDSSILLFFQLAVLSAFLGPDQIATETLLAADPEVFPWVQKYQRSRETVSETDYEVSANLEICLHGFVNILDLTVGLKFSFRLI